MRNCKYKKRFQSNVVRPLNHDFGPVLGNACRCLAWFALDFIYQKKIGQHICQTHTHTYIYIHKICIHCAGFSFDVGTTDFITPLHEGVFTCEPVLTVVATSKSSNYVCPSSYTNATNGPWNNAYTRIRTYLWWLDIQIWHIFTIFNQYIYIYKPL